MGIHIIDDEICITDILSELLSPFSDEILCFQSAEAYLLHMHSDAFVQPCLIMTDVRMSNMNGFILIRNIRRIHSTVKIIVMSGFSGHQETEKLYNAKVSKPFDIPLLLSTVAQLYSDSSSAQNI